MKQDAKHSIDDIVKMAEEFEEATSFLTKMAKKWKKMPKGWTAKSRKDFFQHLAKGKARNCIKEMKGKVSDPGVFCGSLKRRVKGK